MNEAQNMTRKQRKAKSLKFCRQRIKAKKDEIEEIEEQLKDLRQKEKELFVEMHKNCPHCGGHGYVSCRANMYENGRELRRCSYKIKWLEDPGSAPPDKEWREFCYRNERPV